MIICSGAKELVLYVAYSRVDADADEATADAATATIESITVNGTSRPEMEPLVKAAVYSVAARKSVVGF